MLEEKQVSKYCNRFKSGQMCVCVCDQNIFCVFLRFLQASFAAQARKLRDWTVKRWFPWSRRGLATMLSRQDPDGHNLVDPRVAACMHQR